MLDTISSDSPIEDHVLPEMREARRVLIVERSASLRQRVSALLGSVGIATDEAATQEDAILACARHTPDLIVLDGQMPHVSSLALLDRLRAMSPAAAPKVIYCVSAHLFDDIWAALAHGADEYLIRPFDDSVLALKMQALGLLDMAEMQRAVLACNACGL